ncbi:MAG: mechanosensitive ion channel family protein [Nakamurella sp.]
MTLPAAAPPGDAWTWWGNTAAAWTGALLGAIAAVAVVYVVMRLVRRRLLPRVQTTTSAILRGMAAAVDAVRLRYLIPIALLAAAGFLNFPSRLEFWLRLTLFVFIGLQVVLGLNRLMVTALTVATAPDPGQQRPVMLTIITWTVQLVVWLIFLLVILAALNVNITALVASLGVGGIAVALALQNILSDLFASVSIGLDKPFKPGEYIEFDSGQGTVRHIGIKSTRIESLSGEELAIANSKLLEKLTHNFSRMNERRVVFGFTVPFSTTRDQLREITSRVNVFISAVDRVRFSRGHFTGFGDAGFTFEFVYYVLDSDYTLYLDIQQTINDEIIGVAESLGVAFAIPARRVEWSGRDPERA